jgi:hypothetical protein
LQRQDAGWFVVYGESGVKWADLFVALAWPVSLLVIGAYVMWELLRFVG